LLDIDQLSIFFHPHTLQKICNKIITKDDKNDLPTDVVNFRTLESFKRTIQLVDFSNHLTSSSNQ